MTASRIGVILVGAGVIAHTHAQLIRDSEDLSLAAIVDTVSSAAVELASAGEPVFSALQDALREVEADLVVITTPSGTHAELASEALRAGRHVLVEKPVDIDVRRARALQEHSEARPLQVVSVMSQNRYAPAVSSVRRAIAAGRLGKLTSATATLAWWRDDDYYASAPWRGTWAADGGGALMNQGVHTVDLLLTMLGEPVSVSGVTATVGHEGLEVEDVAAAIVTFASGAVATLLASTAAFPENSTRVQVHGTRGSAYLQDGGLEYFHADDAHDGGARHWGRAGDQSAREVGSEDRVGTTAMTDLQKAHRRQYDDVVDAIRTGRRPDADVQDAVTALAVIVAVYLSSTLGHPVLVADVKDGVYDDIDYRIRGAYPAPTART